MAIQDSNTIIKFADDTTDHRKCCDRLWGGGQRPGSNNLSLNVSKTKELIKDYRKRQAEQAPINIDGAVEERVES